MTRTDTERLEFLLHANIKVDGSFRDDFGDFTLQFRAPIRGKGVPTHSASALVRYAIDAAMNLRSKPSAPDPRRERLARAMTTHSSRPWEDMNENTRNLHLAEADRLLAAIDKAD